jgi:hypothetical protein
VDVALTLVAASSFFIAIAVIVAVAPSGKLASWVLNRSQPRIS